MELTRKQKIKLLLINADNKKLRKEVMILNEMINTYKRYISDLERELISSGKLKAI